MSVACATWRRLGSLCLLFLVAGFANSSAPEPVTPPPVVEGNASLIGKGTTDLTNQLALDATPKVPLIETLRTDRALASWYEWKFDLFERYALQFSLAYSALAHHASETRPGKEDDAVGGVFDFGGTWAPFNRGGEWQGMLGFRIADQHKLGTKIAPAAFGDEIGSAWGTSLAFDDISLTVIEGWWEQRLGSKSALRFGKLDASGVFDPATLGNPFEHFMGQTFNLNSSIAFPAEGLGLLVNVEPLQNFSIMVGIVDSNGNGKDWNFDSFFTEQEHLKLAEVSWFPDTGLGRGEYHLTVWDSDERDDGMVPSGHGYTLYAAQRVGGITPFLRYGHSSGGAAALKNMVATGIGFHQPFGRRSDGIGLGLSWGEPFGENAREQYGVEAYYRIQLTRELAVTPDIQYIIDPARHPAADSTVVLSLRLRANL